MKEQEKNRISRLALRIALIASAGIGVVQFFLIFLLFRTEITYALGIAVLTLFLSFGIIYFVVNRIQLHRIKVLNQITRNIAQKHFEDYETLHKKEKDEIDDLIKQAVRASKTVQREIQRLNRIENYRKEFIGDISHELKTPIFAIQGFVETLLNGALEDERVNRRFLQKAMRNVNRLTYLTQDLMEISKLETGELKSEPEEVLLREVVMDVVEGLQYKARKEGIKLKVGPIDKNLLVRADRNQLRQVFVNLIENGIKYNKPGGSVSITVRPLPTEGGRVQVRVEDTGIGIEPEYLDRVTERFFRVDKSRARDKGGTGLGLAIVKHIMEAHGEHFQIKSTPNIGSTFSFTLTTINSAKELE